MIARIHLKNLGTVVNACNSRTGEAETGECLETLGPFSLAYSMSAESVRDPFSKDLLNHLDGYWRRIPDVYLQPSHTHEHNTCTPLHTYTHEHMHKYIDPHMITLISTLLGLCLLLLMIFTYATLSSCVSD